MSALLSVDPGLRGCGCAMFDEEKLIGASYVHAVNNYAGSLPFACALAARAVEKWVHALGQLDKIALEWPRTYGGRAQEGDARDLLPLAGVDAAIAVLFMSAEIYSVSPSEWKGTISKPKSTADPYPIRVKVESRLSQGELASVEWTANVRHSWDVADAIGIGLYILGRFERKRVYSRE